MVQIIQIPKSGCVFSLGLTAAVPPFRVPACIHMAMTVLSMSTPNIHLDILSLQGLILEVNIERSSESPLLVF